MGGVYLKQAIREKHYEQGTSTSLSYYSVEMQGWRKEMEDAKFAFLSTNNDQFPSLFGVFDGHGGLEVSNLASELFLQFFKENFKNLSDIKESLRKTFMDFDPYLLTEQGTKRIQNIRLIKKVTEFTSTIISGSTSNVIAIYKNKIYCANAGDSRSVLAYKNGKSLQLSFDHKPQNQQQYDRILNAGGRVSMGRIDNGLNLSRAIGDLQYKNNTSLTADKQKVIACPDIRQVEMDGTQDFIIMGCDGVWQKYVDNCQGMVDQIIQRREKGKKGKQLLGEMVDSMCATSTTESAGTGCDNMTALLIEFKSKGN